MKISNNMAQNIRDDVSTMEMKGDAIIVHTLKIPRDIFQKGGRECSDYKNDIQRQLLVDHRIHSVFVRWTVEGYCLLELAV